MIACIVLRRTVLTLAALALAEGSAVWSGPGGVGALPPEIRRQPQGPILVPGPHAVGFRAIAVRDESRGYWPKVDYRGRRSRDDVHRPLVVQLWYPARRASGRVMRFRDYFNEYLDLRARILAIPGEVNRTAQLAAHLGPLRSQLGPDPSDSAFRRVLDTTVTARRDAAPLAGPFPVILTTALDPAAEQSARWEYLASHGYVVAALPWVGSSPFAFAIGEWQPNGINAMAGDIGFLYAWLREFPAADRQRVAWAGAMTPAGAIMQSRTRLIDAFAVLEGDWEAVESTPGFDPNAFTIPMLNLTTAEVDSTGFPARARRAERWIGRIDIPHVSTYQFARVAHPARAGEHAGWETMTLVLHRFLDATLRGDTVARAELAAATRPNGLPHLTLHHVAPLPRVPTAPEFLQLVIRRRFADAMAVLRAARAEDATYVPAAEEDLILAARFASFGARGDTAAPAFDIVLAAFPRSPAAHEAAGDIAMMLNARGRARTHFEDALRLVPAIADSLARATLDTRVRGKLSRLPPR